MFSLEEQCTEVQPALDASGSVVQCGSPSVLIHPHLYYLKKKVQTIGQVASDMISLEDNPLDMLFQSSVW